MKTLILAIIFTSLAFSDQPYTDLPVIHGDRVTIFRFNKNTINSDGVFSSELLSQYIALFNILEANGFAVELIEKSSRTDKLVAKIVNGPVFMVSWDEMSRINSESIKSLEVKVLKLVEIIKLQDAGSMPNSNRIDLSEPAREK